MVEEAPVTNATSDPQVEQLGALQKKIDELENTNKALQRTLHNERQRGGSLQNLEHKLEANEKLLLATLESLGKVQSGESVDIKSIVEAHKEAAPKPDKAQEAAAVAIVAAFDAAGISRESYEQLWLGDMRFAEPARLYSEGKYQEAVKATVASLLKKPEEKKVVYNDEELKAKVDEAVAKDRQARAAQVPGAKESASGTGEFDYEAWKAKPAAERVKDLAKAKKYMQEVGSK